MDSYVRSTFQWLAVMCCFGLAATYQKYEAGLIVGFSLMLANAIWGEE